MTDLLGRLSNIKDLFSMGGDAVIELLAMIVDGLGTGTEFSGEQLDRLGELAQQLADKVRAMKGGDEAPAGT